MARVSRRELKEDEFIHGFEETLEFLEEQKATLIALALVVVLGAGALGSLWWYGRRQEARASIALGRGLEIFSAPIRANPAAAPDAFGPSFASEKEKYEAAQREFARLRREFSGTTVAVIAKHYEALALVQLGEQDKGIGMLEEVSRAANRERAAVAKLHLGSLYEKSGRVEDARKLYRALAADPTLSVPRPVALLALADSLAGTSPAEARNLYEEVKRLVGESPVSSQVDHRLEALPPNP